MQDIHGEVASPLFTHIGEELEIDYDDKGEYFERMRKVGITMGCDCCTGKRDLTPENIREHIDRLKSMIVKAKQAMTELFPEEAR